MTGFRYPRTEQESLALKTPSFDIYLHQIGQWLPKQLNLEILDPLRNLPSVLRRGSLLVLNPVGSEFEACKGYAIGPKGAQVGDMMIPLWYPEWHVDASFVLPGESVTAVNAVTMLAVTPTGDKCFQHGIISLDEEARRGVPRGKVVGPAVCVFPGGLPGDKRLTGVRWVGNLDKGQRCFTCLV